MSVRVDLKAIVLNALKNYRGDNFERATYAFKSYTSKQMQEQHGQSGRTRDEILNEYREHVRDVESAIAWISNLKEPT